MGRGNWPFKYKMLVCLDVSKQQRRICGERPNNSRYENSTVIKSYLQCAREERLTCRGYGHRFSSSYIFRWVIRLDLNPSTFVALVQFIGIFINTASIVKYVWTKARLKYVSQNLSTDRTFFVSKLQIQDFVSVLFPYRPLLAPYFQIGLCCWDTSHPQFENLCTLNSLRTNLFII